MSRLRAEIQKVLTDPGFAQKLSSAGPEPFVLSAQEFDALIRRDYEKYGEVVRTIGLKIN